MILAPITEPFLREAVRRGARADEDVLHDLQAIRTALSFGHPRLLVCAAADRHTLIDRFPGVGRAVPLLAVTETTVTLWNDAWANAGLALSRIDDSALRLRELIEQRARRVPWVDHIHRSLTRLLGRSLPPEFTGFSRRVLEFPYRYATLSDIAGVAGVSVGALKARFRRRGLPSPARYLRWLRLLAVARTLSDPRVTTLEGAFRLRFTSDGNLCRWILANSGLRASELRKQSPEQLLVGMAAECFPEGAMAGWVSLGGLFLRRVA